MEDRLERTQARDAYCSVSDALIFASRRIHTQLYEVELSHAAALPHAGVVESCGRLLRGSFGEDAAQKFEGGDFIREDETMDHPTGERHHPDALIRRGFVTFHDFAQRHRLSARVERDLQCIYAAIGRSVEPSTAMTMVNDLESHGHRLLSDKLAEKYVYWRETGQQFIVQLASWWRDELEAEISQHELPRKLIAALTKVKRRKKIVSLGKERQGRPAGASPVFYTVCRANGYRQRSSLFRV